MKTTAMRLAIGVALLTLSIVGPLGAQNAAATLSGTVTNPSGAPVAGASVSVRNLATGQSQNTETSAAGLYRIDALPPGEYEVSVTSAGFTANATRVTLDAGAQKTLDVGLAAADGQSGAPSLGDLGFPTQQTQGNAQQQALLDRRSHMLQIHQRLGLITAVPMVAALVTSDGAQERHGSTTGRDVHVGLGLLTTGLYFTTASYAIRAPKVPGTPTRGPIRLHKALAWVHGTGMVVTPILGLLAYRQVSRGERVHGIAKAHSVAAWTTAIAYGSAIVSVSFRF